MLLLYVYRPRATIHMCPHANLPPLRVSVFTSSIYLLLEFLSSVNREGGEQRKKNMETHTLRSYLGRLARLV